MAEQIVFLEISEQRARAVRRGQRLEYLTIGWNMLEALVSLIAGINAGSIALIGFGYDSLIEVAAGLGLLWRLSVDAGAGQRERAERTALKLIGVCFFLLAAYIAYDAGRSLINRQPLETSYAGIALAVAASIVMPLLARAKRRVAVSLGSRAMRADSRQTDICGYLSIILLGGLALNALLGWWWTDPVAGLLMIPIICKEGLEALRGETCCGEGACQ